MGLVAAGRACGVRHLANHRPDDHSPGDPDLDVNRKVSILKSQNAITQPVVCWIACCCTTAMNAPNFQGYCPERLGGTSDEILA